VVAGGRRIKFRALVVVGNHQGKVGAALGKGQDVAMAVAQARSLAAKRLVSVPIVNETIPHGLSIKYGGVKLILKPARPGTSIIAGGPVRAVVELAGIKNVVCKSFGSANKNNMVKATLLALRKLKASDKSSLENTSQVKEEVKGGATKEEVLIKKQESKSKLKRVSLDKEEGENET
jgi:small subunit ribosomal protein S5